MSTAPKAAFRLFVVEGLRARELAPRVDDGAAKRSVAELLDEAGAVVYEGVRTYDGACFFGLAEHFKRLAVSCAKSGLANAFEPDDVHRALIEAGARFRLQEGVDARVRIDVCRAPLALYESPGNVLLTLSAFHGVARSALLSGVEVATTDEVRRADPEVKDSHWTVVRERLIGATPRLAACYEPMLLDDAGRLLEGVQSNLVLVRNGKPFTAPAGVLRGVTRDAVLELSPDEPVLDFVALEDLERFDEAFLTSSVRGVVPIVKIDGRPLGDGRPGPLTRELMARYEAHVAQCLR